jgi:putative N6-adenine-specific DNA methylase
MVRQKVSSDTRHPIPGTRFFATCARGLEPVLATELRQIGATDVEPSRGGVGFAGDRATLYKANLWLRTAVRVLQPVLEADVESPDELYQAVQSIDWPRYLTPDQTLAVDCNVRDSKITHSLYAALKTKDAICDQFIARVGRRPSVDTERPMVGLNLHIARDHCILSLDSSGDSLHKRGYRPVLTKAPLNEALAAALVLRSGWDPHTPFVDPLCGSGALPIEAAWVALRRPPGLTRKHFGFMGWIDYDVALWSEVRDEARRGVLKKLPAPVLGFDVRRDAIEHSRGNARAAGIGHLLTFERQDVRDFVPPAGPPGTIICNPPYGERIGEEKELRPLYATLGEVFATRCGGWNCCVFTGNERLARAIRQPAREAVPLWNGKIPCRLLRYAPAPSA